jgi:hypothetical protein
MIAGGENQPAEQVFKNVQLLRASPPLSPRPH